jgi:CRISPR system Cascade subunit CasA
MNAGRFNVVDEPWIPIVDIGLVGLRAVFTDPGLRALGGNPIQKVSVIKLLLAIAQSACRDVHPSAWGSLSVSEMARKSSEYLDKWHDRFSLFGDTPFLQFPQIAAAAVKPYAAVMPEVASGNTTVLTESQVGRAISDGEKALLLVTLMAFSFAGKKTDNSVVLTPGYNGKTNEKGCPSAGKSGPAVGHLGFLHSFVVGTTLQQTIWINLLNNDQIAQCGMYGGGLGVPPWENMPSGESCSIAKNLQQSLIGRLIPLSRFCLLREDGLHYSEGISHPGYAEGVSDPSVSVDFSGTKPKALWVNPEQRPWRELVSLLGFLEQEKVDGSQCLQVRHGVQRARIITDMFGIWSGGVRVSSNAGEQYISGTDDVVESVTWLTSDTMGTIWFVSLKSEMDLLKKLEKQLYATVSGYFKDQKLQNAGAAKKACSSFWMLVEKRFSDLVQVCARTSNKGDDIYQLRERFVSFLYDTYDRYCPKESARQLEAWARNRPRIGTYLRRES